MRVNFHMDALAIQTWGQEVDAVIHSIPSAVEWTALIVLTLLHATVMMIAILLMTVAMISLKLDVLVSHTAGTLYSLACMSVYGSILHLVGTFKH